MDLNGLSLLVEIVDAQTLSEAARRLQMSRANVSHRLARFESTLGQQLLRRTTRRIEPTELGHLLYAHGSAIRDELQAAKESLTTIAKTPQGRVRLSVPSGYGQLVMSDWLIDFKRLYPKVSLEVIFDNRVEDLLRDEVDVAVRTLVDPPQNLVARHMGTVRYVACATAQWAHEHGLPQSLYELQNFPLITSQTQGRWFRVDAVSGAERHEILLEPALASQNLLFLRQAILAGLGIGIVPSDALEKELLNGQVVATLTEWSLCVHGAQVYMLYMPGRHRSKALSMFIEYMQSRAQEHARQLTQKG